MYLNWIRKQQHTTPGIAHTSYSRLRAFVARKKGWFKLMESSFEIPHDIIP